MLTIRQTETGWELVRDGQVLTVDVAGEPTSTFATYEDAVATVATMMLAAAQLQVEPGTEPASGDGLLPEVWESPPDGGIAYCAATGDGRDFSDCVWSWRDPATAFVPLMLQTETEYGHFGAELAGFVEAFTGGGNATVGARGRFFDSDAGRQFRDMMLGGRTFSVSVDPGAVTWDDECLEVDDDGWCSQWMTRFLTYTIIGVTGTPFAGFEDAQIQLADTSAPVAASAAGPERSTRTAGDRAPQRATTPAEPRREAVTAAAVTTDPLLAPPASWFQDPGFLMPTPLTITNQGRVLGHVAIWNTSHVGRPGVTPPRGCDMQDFMQGSVITDDGQRIRTGVLTWMMEHPDDELSLHETIAAYNRAAADSGLGWADAIAGEDSHGPWVSGALRPGLTDVQIRVIRALSLSGDWRYSQRVGRYEMLGVLAVNYPGFPITAAARSLGIPVGKPHHSEKFQVITASAGMVPQGARREPVDALAARVASLESRYVAEARAKLHGIRQDVALSRLRG